MSKFEIGKQPCDNYDPDIDGNGYGQWENVHECWCDINGKGICGGEVSSCMNCNKDHHAGGYESCKGCTSEQKTERSERKLGVV